MKKHFSNFSGGKLSSIWKELSEAEIKKSAGKVSAGKT